MSSTYTVTILGCGSSGGVPRADGNWGVCDPGEPRNRRSRCSIAIQRWTDGRSTNVVVDCAPEFRLQSNEAQLRHLDAVVFTHDHADQTHGLDDVRAFFLRQGSPIPAFMDKATWASLKRRFGYCFAGGEIEGYPAILRAQVLETIPGRVVVEGAGGPIELTLLDQDHGSMRSLGVRCGPFAYSNDVVRLPKETMDQLKGLDVWVVDALRHRAHPTHANVETALGWARELAPKRTILTNMHIDLDYRTLQADLPLGVEPAFDNMRITWSEDTFAFADHQG